MSRFQDHFSGHAALYRDARPSYPPALFAAMAAHAPARQAVWDCGCGNGQASIGLAAYFDSVIATDASAKQIAEAMPHPRVSYSVAPAEQSGLPDGSADAVLVAQALHWFDIERFYDEVERVARPGALFVAVAYGLARIEPKIDAIVLDFYRGPIGPYWPEDRAHIETGYKTLPRRFPSVEMVPVNMEALWPLDRWLAYLETWSAVQRYRAATGDDPLPALRESLLSAWVDPTEAKRIIWPLTMLTGRVN